MPALPPNVEVPSTLTVAAAQATPLMSATAVTAVSLFSGCGGFDMGATQAGVKILWANDINKHAGATYRKYFPNVEFRQGDIRKIPKSALPQADILIGCYPCQGFSDGARRRWKEQEEPRDLFDNVDNYLYKEFVRSIPYVRPKFIFIENVRGLKSSAKGWFFRAQREALEQAGYIVYDTSLNTRNYGIPQSRQRIFIVGVRKDIAFTYAFPSVTHGPDRQHPFRSQQDVIAGLPEWPRGEYQEAPFHGHFLTRCRKMAWIKPSYTIVAHSHHVPLHPMGEPMEKLGKDLWELRGTDNRRLSWRECGVLQSFSENFEPEGPLDAKYLQIGNSVPPRMGELLMAPVVGFLRSQNRPSTLPLMVIPPASSTLLPLANDATTMASIQVLHAECEYGQSDTVASSGPRRLNHG